jgi:acyl-CoA thioesterase-1
MTANGRVRSAKFASRLVILAVAMMISGGTACAAAIVVALGASNTYGKGVGRNEAYPAQLEALLRADGHQSRVVNAGINGDTTGGMLRRLDRAVPKGTAVVIVQPGGNDRRKGIEGDRAGNIAAIEQRLRARGIKVIVAENGMTRRLPHQPDGQHLTPEGYRMLAQALLGQVEAALGGR